VLKELAMNGYQTVAVADPFQKDPRQSAPIPAPPGYDVDDTTRELAREAPDYLPRFGLVTLWALRRGDVEWMQLNQPQETNIELFRVSDVLLGQLFRQAYGLELPYLAVLTKRALTQTELKQAFEGTPYTYLQTNGIYAQTDKQMNPRAFYLHWLQRQGAGKGGKMSPERAAQQIGGTFLFAQQVPAAETSLRPPPQVNFADAQLKARIQRLPSTGIATQSLFISQVGGLGDTPAVNPAAPTQQNQVVPYVLVGAGALLTYLLLSAK
jgi:hypothetical protein